MSYSNNKCSSVYHLKPLCTPSITHTPAFGKYCSILVNAHTSLEGWFIDKNVEAQRGPFLKSHRWKALGLRFECRQPNSRCLGYFNTSAFQMHFFNPKISLKMKMCVEIQYIKEIKLQLLNLNGVVLGELLLLRLILRWPLRACLRSLGLWGTLF